MKKITIILAMLGFVYTSSWYSIYKKANLYYKFATEFEIKGEYIYAVKGKKDDNGYMGGYQIIVDMFENTLFKPSIYKDSKKKIKIIINEKINEKLGKEIFEKYFGKDNKYLEDIVVRVYSLIKKRDIHESEEYYLEMLEAFPMSEKIKNMKYKEKK